MSERTLFEFDRFRLDPVKRMLFRNGQPIPLRAKPFELLQAFVENHGHSISKEELINRVWPDGTGTDANFHVNLDAVRKALGETGREPHLILRTNTGYRLVVDVKTVASQEKQSNIKQVESQLPSGYAHLVRALAACILYASLFAGAVLLEIAYKFDSYHRTGFKIATMAFVWIALTSAAALELDRKLVFKDKKFGLSACVLTFLISAALVFICVTRFLPDFPITLATFQTYSAQAAYLKDTVYFLALALLFLILPSHFISTMEHEINQGRRDSVAEALTGARLAASSTGAIYPRFWALASLLVVFAALAIAMTAHLLDNLQDGPYKNLFIQLVYLRGVLYFGLGIERLVWYRTSLDQLKHQSLFSSDSVYYDDSTLWLGRCQ
jgi:DNA-binding winged helix-turn-helix (wHTH) protein